MESTIRLCYCAPFPLNLSYGSKGSQLARPSNFHLRFNYATPLSLPQISTTRYQVASPFRDVKCMLETFSLPSKNEGSDNKVLRGVTQVSLVLACVLGLLNFSSKMNPKITTAYAAAGAKYDISAIENQAKGKVVLESLLKMLDAPEDSGDMNQSPSPYAEVAFKGDLEDARKLLDQKIDKLLDRREQNGKTRQPYMRLLDLYKQTDSSQDKIIISRLLLCKAIVHTMLEDEDKRRGKGKEAVEWRKTFMKTFNEG